MSAPPSLPTLRSWLVLFLGGAAAIAVASCDSDGTETAASPPDLGPAEAPNPPESAAASALRTAFPAQAARVLGHLSGAAFEARDRVFVRPSTASPARHLDIHLPRDGGGVIRVSPPGGGEIAAREIGLEGEGAPAESAVAYRRAGGTSFWTVTAGGAEEWLHLARGAVTSEEQVAAAWEIEGARVVARNGAIALMDEAGVARAWVTAHEAFGEGGRPVAVRLAAVDNRIELHADARGEEVLIDPGWVAVAPVVAGRFAGNLVTLANGRALLANGYTGSAIPGSAEVYDPATNAWSNGGAMITPRYLAGAALLGSGRVMVFGGQTLASFPTATEQYDPALNTWSASAAMTSARGQVNGVALANGRVLAAGGYSGLAYVASAEQYNPATNTWSSAGTMSTPRGLAAIVLLANGRVLVAGGANGNINAPTALASAEVYNPANNSWTSAGTMTSPRYFAQAALLPNGRVIVAGGATSFGVAQTTVEIYDPATNSWSAGAPLATARATGAALVVGNGQFLVAGGLTGIGGVSLASSELYDPVANSWASAGNMNALRYLPQFSSIGGGDMLVVGGSTDGTAALSSADRYYYASLVNGVACVVGQQCQSGFCVDGVCCGVASCTALDQCHDAGTCQAGTGTCSNPNKPNGTSCDDGSACTQADTCQSGACAGANPVVCVALDPCHDAGTCNPLTGVCDNPPKQNGAACNDGNPCTQTDTCMAGACSGGNPVMCVASDSCHLAGTCDPATGACSNPVKADGAACEDGNPCTQADTCMAGACAAGSPVVCAPLDQCHDAGACDPANGGCSNPAKADGTACDDSDACTQADSCIAGACTGANPVTCMAQDQCHVAGTCDPATGICDDPPKPEGAACDDGDPCTQADTCSAGACAAGPPVTCPEPDECHDLGACDAANGTCENPTKPDGTPCSKGTCMEGVCQDSGTGGAGGATGGTGGAGGSGASGGTSTGGGDKGGSDSGIQASGGCGCRVAGSETGRDLPATALFLLAFSALLRARRRPSPRA